MNKTVIFLFIATAILVFSIICVSVAPTINNLLNNFTDWGKLNCKYYSNKAKFATTLNEQYKNEQRNNLCIRQNAMHYLEYLSFYIDLAIGFVCAQLALMHYFEIGKPFEKKTGLIGLFGGAIGFILTLIYVCFSGYIFNNDGAFLKVRDSTTCLKSLYSNGATYKLLSDGKMISKDYYLTDYYDYCAKYKDLGKKEYNYDRERYEAYYRDNNLCNINTSDSSCEFLYDYPYQDNRNKYLYNRWCLSLVLAVFITVLNIALFIFGLLIYKSSGFSDNTQLIEAKIQN